MIWAHLDILKVNPSFIRERKKSMMCITHSMTFQRKFSLIQCHGDALWWLQINCETKSRNGINSSGAKPPTRPPLPRKPGHAQSAISWRSVLHWYLFTLRRSLRMNSSWERNWRTSSEIFAQSFLSINLNTRASHQLSNPAQGSRTMR